MWIKCLLLISLLTVGYCSAAQESQSVANTSAQSITQLTGTWRFNTGDDARWSSTGFDDTGWETMDLTPVPGAHDGDVGITGYLPGWRVRNHENYWGYAWYRKRVPIAAYAGREIAILAPNDVEDAYQFFCNGTLIGQSGDFSGKTPAVYNPKPQMHTLTSCAGQGGDVLIAVRVWMGPQAGRDDDAGGIHVAPALGDLQAIDGLYHKQWMEVFYGYIVDAVEPAGFLLLAVMAGALVRGSRTPTFYRWLCIALTLTALVRGNQSLFAWTDVENLDTFMMVKYVVLLPMGLAAWAITWLIWLAPSQRKWMAAGITILLLLPVAMVISALNGEAGGPFGGTTRKAMALLYIALAVFAVISKKHDRLIALVAMVLVAIGQFAGELSGLGIPGIWFSFGVGVSRTQFAYAALIPCLAIWLRNAYLRHVETL